MFFHSAAQVQVHFAQEPRVVLWEGAGEQRRAHAARPDNADDGGGDDPDNAAAPESGGEEID